MSVLPTAFASAALTAGAGVLLGMLLSIALSNYVQKWTETSMRNAAVLGIICGIIALVAGIACLLPAVCATRVNPIVALRENG